MTYDATLEGVKALYRKAVEAEDEIRRAAQEEIAFEDGAQWQAADRSNRLENGRPCLVINKVAGVVKQVVGDARRNRPKIKFRAVDSISDPAIATLLTGLSWSVEAQSDAESAYDWAIECAARGGFGYWKVATQYAGEDVFEQDVVIERVTDPFSVILDPAHRKPTGEDANFAFELHQYEDREAFLEDYPEKEASSWDVLGIGVESDDDAVWVCRFWRKEPVQKEIFQTLDGKVVEIEEPQIEEINGYQTVTGYHKDQPVGPLVFRKHRTSQCYKVKWQVWSASELLEEGDWAGQHIPIVQVIGEEVWIEGKRKLRSVHYHAHDAQRLYNWARSNAAETLAMAPRQPLLATPDMIDGHKQQWNEANRRPSTYLLFNETPLGFPQRQPPSLSDIGAVQESQMAADDIKATTGIYDASLGARSNETSGVAIRARQGEGDNATFVFHDNHSKSIRFTGKILADLIPRIYDTERILRITNEDGKEGVAAINVVDPATGQIINDLTIGKYDVYVDAGPSYQTQRVEAADGMLRLIQSFPQLALALAGDLAKILDWPDAQKIGEKIEALLGRQNQTNPQQQAQAQKDQLDMQGKHLVNQQRTLDLLERMQAAMTGGYSA